MKVNSEHLELIRAATTFLNEDTIENQVRLNLAIDKSNALVDSIAPVEPEPLAKNKQTESCNHPLDTLTKMFGGMYCDECKSYVDR